MHNVHNCAEGGWTRYGSTSAEPRSGRLRVAVRLIQFLFVMFVPSRLVAQASTVDPAGTIQISPANTANQTVTFRITNTTGTRTRFILQCSASGFVTSCSSPTSVLLNGFANTQVSVTYSTGTSGTGTLTETSSDPSGIASGYYSIQAADPQVAVTPDSQDVSIPDQSVGQSYLFTVKNPGNTTGTISLTVPTCSAPASSCNLARTSVTLGVNASDTVRVTFNSGAAGPIGQVRVRGSVGSHQDDGFINVAAYVQAPLQNPALTGPGIERRLCLTIAAGPSGASECGDLRLVHPLPRIATKGQSRGPVLLYNSQTAHPYVLLSDTVGLLSTDQVPTNVQATLTFNGTQIGTRTWNGSDWSPGTVRQIVFGFDGTTPTNYATGSYTYSLLLQKTVNGSPITIRTDTGHVIIVNRATSPFGPGWWLAGLNQIQSLSDGTKLLIGGDGTTRIYYPVSGRTDLWAAPQLDHPENLQLLNSYFVQLLPGGAKVFFDAAAGIHRKTANRLGDTTFFTWSDSACQHLNSITVPLGPSPSYRLSYAGSGCPTLASVSQTAGGVTRTTSLGFDDSQTLRITDPDNAYVRYYYSAAGGQQNEITKRFNRIGDSTTYAYDGALKLSQVSEWVGAGGNATALTTSFFNVQSKSLNGATAIDTSLALTAMDGARTDVADTTKFWLDRFGAPRKIRGPLGDSTAVKLTRGDARWPALVTRVDSPHGRVQVASYDTHGNVLSITDSSSHRINLGQTLYGTTSYQWDLQWDRPIKITLPEGPYTQFAYDLVTGNPRWIQDARGMSARTSFTYVSSGVGQGLVSTMKLPNGATTSFGYDALGNFASVQNALGYYVYHIRDALGRDSVVRTQIDPAGTVFQSDSTLYDLNDLPTRFVRYGPALNGASDQRLVTQFYYDKERRDTAVKRASIPDTNHIGNITTRTKFDAVGRKTISIATDQNPDSVFYDAAGNDTLIVTRRRYHIRKHFDAMNRMVWRSVDSVLYAPRRQGLAALAANTQLSPRDTIFPRYANAPNGAYAIPGDTATFAFDAAGHLTTANNGAARIARTYYTNGLDSTETQAIRTWNDTTFSAHVYTLQFTYDLDGQRTKIKHPDVLVGAADSAVWYYNYGSNNLMQAVDLLGKVHSFSFDSLNQQVERSDPGGIYEEYRYNVDGTLALDSIQNNSTSPNRYTDSFLRQTRFSYDARQKESSGVNGAGMKDHPHMLYSGLGFLRQSIDTSQKQVGDPSAWTTNEIFTYDAFANQVLVTRATTSFPWPGETSNVQAGENFYYAPDSTGRLIRRFNNGENDSLIYNKAGDVEFQYNNISTGQRNAHDRALYYGADGLLRAVDDRNAVAFNGLYNSGAYYTFDEYRYDAFGRRVLTRSRRKCDMNGRVEHRLPCLVSYLRRTVWDGSMELDEVQMPAGDTSTTAPAVTDAIMEQDAGYAPLQKVDTLATNGPTISDPNPFFGRVAYTYGLSVDQPVSVNRYGYLENAFSGDSAHHFAAYELSPMWNAQGVVDLALFGDGGSVTCDQTGQTQRCTRKVLWLYALTAYWRSVNDQLSWQGTLLEDKQDGSGMLYRRARYFDPEVGRFTQEDPLELAAGANTYGFGGGDPANYADPFGLRVCFPQYDPRGHISGGDPDEAVRSTKEATQTDFELDANRCIINLRPRGKSWTPLGLALSFLVADQDNTYNVFQRRGAMSEFVDDPRGSRSYWAYINTRSFDQPVPIEVGGSRRCVANADGAPRRTLDTQIVHELLGHGLGIYFRQDTRTAAGLKNDQVNAVGITNLYLSSHGLPASCSPDIIPWPPQ